jgi:5-methylcytosine-specific restriction protein B
MAEQAAQRQVQIAGERFRLRAPDVESAMLSIAPEPITSHFVVVGSRRYPPKQVISAVTGLDRADFTTHQARRILMRLGFAAVASLWRCKFAAAQVPDWSEV